jgi:proteasome accessory factor B
VSQRENIKRLASLLNRIRNGYPSKEELLDYMEELGFGCSPRTLERKLKEIRDELWVEVKFDRQKKGYFIEESEINHSASLIKLFQFITTTDILLDNLKESRETLQFIQFDEADHLEGIDLIPELMRALKHNLEISFEHYNFHYQKSYRIALKPLLLKEYDNRWYIIGYNDYVKDYRSYGIDRLLNLHVTEKTFHRSFYQDPKELFTHTVGLSYSVDKPQIVRIAFDKFQANYLKSLPLHHSQEIESEKDGEVIMSYYVVPNLNSSRRSLCRWEVQKS